MDQSVRCIATTWGVASAEDRARSACCMWHAIFVCPSRSIRSPDNLAPSTCIQWFYGTHLHGLVAVGCVVLGGNADEKAAPEAGGDGDEQVPVLDDALGVVAKDAGELMRQCVVGHGEHDLWHSQNKNERECSGFASPDCLAWQATQATSNASSLAIRAACVHITRRHVDALCTAPQHAIAHPDRKNS